MPALWTPEGYERVVIADKLSIPKPADWKTEEFGDYFHAKPVNRLIGHTLPAEPSEPNGYGADDEHRHADRIPLDMRGFTVHILKNVTSVFNADPNTVAGWHFTKDNAMFSPFDIIVNTKRGSFAAQYGVATRPECDELFGNYLPAATSHFLSIADRVTDVVYQINLDIYNLAADPEADTVAQVGRTMLAGLRVTDYPDWQLVRFVEAPVAPEGQAIG